MSFSFLSQPDQRTAGEPSEVGIGGLPSNPPSPAPQLSPSAAPQVQNQPAMTAQQNPSGAGVAMRGLSFEAPMRPLDVQRDMYLDYTNSQAIKFYNKGCEKLSGEAFSGKTTTIHRLLKCLPASSGMSRLLLFQNAEPNSSNIKV